MFINQLLLISFKMDLKMLVKTRKHMPKEWIAEEGEAQLKRIFSLRTAANSHWEYLRQLVTGGPYTYRSKKLYAREEIADKLKRHDLVSGLEEGLQEADRLILTGIGRARFVEEYNSLTDDLRYRLEVTRPLMLNPSAGY